MSYLNTKPLIYGFEKGLMADEMDLITDYPSSIATMLVNDEVDIALIPVATIPLLKEYYIITDYCIGTLGEVASVCLFSDVPLQNIETILLDYQSKSSVALLKILLKEYWKINPKLVIAENNYEQNIIGTTAGLVIGDRAFVQRKKSNYSFDLGTAWNELTGLPFVFAAWIANKKLPNLFIEKFNKSVAIGLQHLPEIIAQNSYSVYDLETYYTKNIEYNFTDKMKLGMSLYLEKLKQKN